MPPFSFQKPLIDIWLQAFPRTRLLMNFDEPEALAYGTQHGAGWRLDCLGDLRTISHNKYFSPEMLDIYPQQIVRAGIQNVWQHSPVSLETCGTPSSWKKDGYDVSYILAQALRWHVSSVNVKSSPIPPEWQSQFEDFQRKMGYRFVLRRLEYPNNSESRRDDASPYVVVECGSSANLQEVLAGCRVAVRQRKYDYPGSRGHSKWLPGDAVADDSLFVPYSLSPGTYKFRIAMLDPEHSYRQFALVMKDARRMDGMTWER